jgi:hypothetical protein
MLILGTRGTRPNAITVGFKVISVRIAGYLLQLVALLVVTMGTNHPFAPSILIILITRLLARLLRPVVLMFQI